MKGLVLLSLCVALACAAEASADTVSRTVSAPEDRVWVVTEAVLKHQGWEIEKADRAIGWITTKTTVSVERSVFNRERILWMDKDEPVAKKDQAVEKTLLDDIGKSL